eukprot:897751-Alexandrium_andersonii.AAC.1
MRGMRCPSTVEMTRSQAQSEYNQKYRKTDEFKLDLPAEKVQALSTIPGKFSDAEPEDYEKEAAQDPNIMEQMMDPSMTIGLTCGLRD